MKSHLCEMEIISARALNKGFVLLGAPEGPSIDTTTSLLATPMILRSNQNFIFHAPESSILS